MPRLLRRRRGPSERRRSIHSGWTGKARRTAISPVAQETATSDAEMSANFVDVGAGQTANAVTANSPAMFCHRLRTIS